MLKVGITGGLGSGKTTISQLFEELGVPVIDTDVISRQLTSLNGGAIPRIREVFGETVFQPDGNLDRGTLRAQIIADEQVRKLLETILHPMIMDEVSRKIAAISSPYVLVVVPLLVETGAYDEMLDRVLVVDCDEQTQVKRALARGGWSEVEIHGMIGKQASREQRLERADDVINTDCKLDELVGRVKALHEKYLGKASQAL